MKSSTESLSALRSNIGSELSKPSSSMGFRALRRVLRRWLKAVLTVWRKSFSSQQSSVLELRLSLITAERTFGGGAKAPGSTEQMYSMSYHAWSSTESMP